jgi:ribosomal protein S18 acetylase RimI-like enzyme
MVARDDERARVTLARRPLDASLTLQRLTRVEGPAATEAAGAIMDVLLEAFNVSAERGPGVVSETLASLADRRFTHYLIRRDGVPVAVARRATFDGISYLSSIGTIVRARGQGLGRLLTAQAMVDAIEAGSEWIHLGVYSENIPARRLYESLGFAMSGEPGPDMLLIG